MSNNAVLPLSPNSDRHMLQVWSEPSMVEAGAYEFADTAKFLTAGQSYTHTCTHRSGITIKCIMATAYDLPQS